MKSWKHLLVIGLLCMPTVLTAQWAYFANAGKPRALLEASDGGWITAGNWTILKLSEAGQVVWGYDYYNVFNYRKAWVTSDGGILAAGSPGYRVGTTLVKLSATGAVLWQKSYDLAGASLNVFCPAPDDGAYMAGDLDSDLLVCRSSAEGEIIWQRSYGTALNDHATGAVPTSDGGIIVLGSCGQSEASPATVDLWVLKLDAAGEIEWQKRLGGDANDLAEMVFQTPEGGFLIAGHSGSFTADGQSRIWLVKLTPTGDLQRQLISDHVYKGSNSVDVRPAAGGSFMAAIADPSSSGLVRTVLVAIGQDGSVIGEQGYSPGTTAFTAEGPPAFLPTEDGGCLLAMTSSTQSGAFTSDSHLIKVLASGEIEWQRAYGSDFSSDEVTLLGRASDGGYILAGTTDSWGGVWQGLWVMRTASDGRIGPTYYFVKEAHDRLVDEPGVWQDVAAAVTDTAAVPQDTALVATASDINFIPWTTQLHALGGPTCTLTISTSGGGTTVPAPGSYVYDTGTPVAINAVPDANYAFYWWSDNINRQQANVTILMDGDKTVSASFRSTYEDPEWLKDLKEKYGCFIATAAYGDPSHPDVEVLRRFRDRYLMKSRAGRAFVKLYYKYSPPFAEFVAKRPVLRAISRTILRPVVALSRFLLGLDGVKPTFFERK
jgi:hypothetical protein